MCHCVGLITKYIKAVFRFAIDGGDLPYNIVENQKFQLYVRRWGPTCITVPNLVKIGQKVAEIWRFNGFQHGICPPSWIFEIYF